MSETQQLEGVAIPDSGEAPSLEKPREEIIDQVGDFYDLPAETLGEAKKVAVYLMGTPEAEAAIRTYISYDTGDPDEKIEELIQTQLKEVKTKGGIWLSKTNTYGFKGRTIKPKSPTNIIIIDSKLKEEHQRHMLRHELIHELADDKEGGSGVYNTRPSTDINEAITELFNLAVIWNNKDIGELKDRIEKIRVGYKKQILEFLSIMDLLQEGEELTLTNIAEIYFDPSMDAQMRRLILGWTISGKTAEKHREEVDKYLRKAVVTAHPSVTTTSIADV